MGKLIVILVLAVGILLIWYLIKATRTIPVANPEILQTYTNTKYGYEISFPNNWQIEEMSNVAIYPPRASAEIWKKIRQLGPFEEPNISIQVLDTSFYDTPGFASDKKLFAILPKEIPVSGVKGFYYQNLCAPNCSVDFDLPLEKGNKTIRISLTSLGKENISFLKNNFGVEIQDIDEETFKTILPTFKFIEGTNSVLK